MVLGDNGDYAGFVNKPGDEKIYMTTTKAGLHSAWIVKANLGIDDSFERLQKKYETISGKSDNVYERFLNFINTCRHLPGGMFGYTQLPESGPEGITTHATSEALGSLRLILPLVPDNIRKLTVAELIKNTEGLVNFLNECACEHGSDNGGFDITPKTFTKESERFASVWGTHLATNIVLYFNQLTNINLYNQVPAFQKIEEFLRNCFDEKTGSFFAFPK